MEWSCLSQFAGLITRWRFLVLHQSRIAPREQQTPGIIPSKLAPRQPDCLHPIRPAPHDHHQTIRRPQPPHVHCLPPHPPDPRPHPLRFRPHLLFLRLQLRQPTHPHHPRRRLLLDLSIRHPRPSHFRQTLLVRRHPRRRTTIRVRLR